MSRAVPAWLHADDPTVARALVAAWLFGYSGNPETGVQIGQSLRPDLPTDEVEEALAGLVQYIADYQWCADDPRGYAWINERIEYINDARAWGEQQCDHILGMAVDDATSFVTAKAAHPAVAS